MRYNKLVRDKIPEIIRKDGGIPITHIADDAEYGEKLKEKFREEVEEFLKAESEEELADVFEVINAICAWKQFNRVEIETIRQKKAQERGGFTGKIILEESRE